MEISSQSFNIVDMKPAKEQQLQTPEVESIREDNYAVKTNGSVQNSVNALQDHLTPVEEVVEEPQKHTYASIVCNPSLAAILTHFTYVVFFFQTDFLLLLFLEVASRKRVFCTIGT